MIHEDYKRSHKNLTYEKVYKYALELFEYDKDKTNHWWLSKHDEFDGLSPFEMVKTGKGRKLVRLMEKCLLS